jgi:hypothetical protein
MGWTLGFKKKPAPVAINKNDPVRQVLASRGDDGTAVRHVVHYAYPQPGADLLGRPHLIEDLKTRGFTVSDAVHDSGLVFEHHRSVADAAFDAFTDELETWFAAAGWGYDGWECAMVLPEHAN